MNKFLGLVILALLLFTTTSTVKAGNPDRTGQAGASELLINPWARSVGLNWINIASVRGVEAMNLNMAGLTLMEGSELVISHTQYLVGWDANINAAGFGTKLGDGALGISVFSMDFGDIEITTEDQPEGEGLGTYTPQYINVALGYSHSFADFIHGGAVLRIISESISDVSAQGIAIDAGLMYTTGPEAFPDKFRFGVSLRNIGSPMRYNGDGLKFRTNVISGDYEQSVGQLSQGFELPSQLNIGASYDMFYQGRHRFTVSGCFTSNSFYKDQFGAGLEYGMKIKNREMIQLRAGYKYEDGILSSEARTNAHTGFSGGFSVDVPFKKDAVRPKVGLDYAFRTANPFSGSHSVGLRVNF